MRPRTEDIRAAIIWAKAHGIRVSNVRRCRAHRSCTLTSTCIDCGVQHHETVDLTALIDWMNGKLIQDAFPHIPRDAREIFISKYCSSCFDALFTNEED